MMVKVSGAVMVKMGDGEQWVMVVIADGGS